MVVGPAAVLPLGGTGRSEGKRCGNEESQGYKSVDCPILAWVLPYICQQLSEGVSLAEHIDRCLRCM